MKTIGIAKAISITSSLLKHTSPAIFFFSFFLSFYIFAAGTSASEIATTAACPSLSRSLARFGQVIPNSKNIIYKLELSSDHPYLDDITPVDDQVFPRLAEFREWIGGLSLPTDPFTLLRRQRDKFLRSRFEYEVENFDKVIEKKIGNIRSMSCVEAALLDEHFQHWGHTRPYEFRAFLLQKPLLQSREKGSSILYFLSTNNEMVAPSFNLIKEKVIAHIESGYEMSWDLHSHPFFTENALNGGDISGTTLPSTHDRILFLRSRISYKLREARVSNGFSTIAVASEQMGDFYFPPSDMEIIQREGLLPQP